MQFRQFVIFAKRMRWPLLMGSNNFVPHSSVCNLMEIHSVSKLELLAISRFSTPKPIFNIFPNSFHISVIKDITRMASDSSVSKGPARVAIIGGGLGGCSTAYFLRKLMGSRVSITLFEKSNHLGGRVCAVKIGDEVVETGGSIFTSGNNYMNTFAKEFALTTQTFDPNSGPVGFYAGNKKMSFTTAGLPSIVGKIAFLWKYGMDSLKMYWHTHKLSKQFANIYELQDKGRCFETPAALLSALSPDFVQMTGVTYENWLENVVGLRKRFCDEVAYSFVANCYCQNLNVHAFVGMIAAAGCNFKLNCVVDGNQQIAEQLLQSALFADPLDSSKDFVRADVKKLSKGKYKRYRLDYCDIVTNEKASAEFDYVVIATPVHQESSLASSECLLPARCDYRIVQRTMFTGDLLKEQLGLQAFKSSKLTGMSIFPTRGGYENDPNTLFLTLSHHLPTDATSKEGYWGTFSVPERTENPSDQIAAAYFSGGRALHFTRWLAYPVYAPMSDPSKDLGKFVLSPGLIYANALERAASCMEMAIISGRNAALLVNKEIVQQNEHKVTG